MDKKEINWNLWLLQLLLYLIPSVPYIKIIIKEYWYLIPSVPYIKIIIIEYWYLIPGLPYNSLDENDDIYGQCLENAKVAQKFGRYDLVNVGVFIYITSSVINLILIGLILIM